MTMLAKIKKNAKKWGLQGGLLAVGLLAGLAITGSVNAQGKCKGKTPNGLCGNELVVFDYGGQDNPGLIPDYIAKYPQKPRWATFVDPPEALQKLRGGFQADLGHITNSNVPFWVEFSQPWDTTKIKDWDNISAFAKKFPGLAPVDGKIYAIPTFFGLTVPVAAVDKVDVQKMKSFKEWTDPKYKGRIAIPDDHYEVFAICMLAFGVKKPFTELKEQDLKKCEPFLRDLVKNVRIFYSDSATVAAAFQTGEIWLAFAWSDVPRTLNGPSGDQTKVAIMKNLGYAAWSMVAMHIKTSRPQVNDLAYDFVNAILADGGLNFFINEWGYGSANGVAMKKIDQKLLLPSGIDTMDADFKKGKVFMYGNNPAMNDYLIQEWDKIKTGQ